MVVMLAKTKQYMVLVQCAQLMKNFMFRLVCFDIIAALG
jgi:hypothetical protein